MADTTSFKIKKGLVVEPIAGAAPTEEGGIKYDLTAHTLELHNGTTASSVVTADHAETLTNKTINGSNNTITNVSLTTGVTGTLPVANGGTGATTALNNNRVIQSSSGTLVEAAAITASRALVSDANGIPTHSAVTSTTLGYLDATSSVQTQLDAKIPKTLTTTTGDMIYASSANTPARLGIGASNQVLKVVGGVPSWAAAPSGGVNYLAAANDGDAIGSWVTYADAAGTSPVDGTGGSPSSTFATSTDSSLRGTTNFLWTHSAANRQGEGFSFDFTIDAADKYSVLQCSFDYLVASGTYADDDLVFYIYDVTNAALIQPAPYKLKNATIAQKFAFEFQATSSTSYRLICHVATSTATAYTIRFDNWNLGPQAKLYGSPVTDWVSYTPTGSWTANSPVYTGKWRRVGDVMEVQAMVVCGGAATAANLTINLPSGYTIDTSKLLSTSADQGILGSGEVLDSGTQNYSPTQVVYNSTTAVGVYMSKSDGTYSVGTPVNATVPIAFGANDSVAIKFSVPISGCSSSVVMSSDAATNVVAANYTTAAGQSISNGATSIIDFGTKVIDKTGSVTTGASWKFSAPMQGTYRVSGLIRYASAAWTAGNTVNVSLYKNGSVYSYIGSLSITASETSGKSVPFSSENIDLIAGDYIDVRTDHGESSARSLQGTATFNHINIERISGPAQIAASETVAARYSTAAGQSISNNSDTIVDFGTKDFDYMGSVTTGGSWKFVAPISGLYAVSGFIEFTNGGGWGVGEEAYAVLYKGGVSQFRLSGYVVQAAHATYVPLPFATSEVRLLAGEYIDIRAYQNSGASLSLLSSGVTNWVSVKRVGNY